MNESMLKAYYCMWKGRGIRLPIQYFFENHLFDLINRTDTHHRLEKSQYLNKPDSFNEGVLYMSCPTVEVKRSLFLLKETLGDNFFDFQFIDLGCGKGKSILVYLNIFNSQSKYLPIGIEYYYPLAEMARKNLDTCHYSSKARIINDDAINFNSYLSTKNAIFFLYNPFGKETLEIVLQKMQYLNEVYLVYIDPVHSELIVRNNFKILYEKKGQYRNRFLSIYYRGNKK